MPLEREHVKAIILQELPAILEQDADVRQLILRLAQQHFANRGETESRFDRVLEELRRDREEQRRTWDENQRALTAAQDEARRTWDENQRALKAAQDEARRTWNENQRALKAMQDEANRKWDEDHQEIMAMIRRMEALDRKYDSTIGALGARWGLYSEQSFRNALRGILTGFFNLEVINVIEYDDTGAVFGRPDQIELDLIIKNGLLIICEIKSSVSKADVYAFERKARWYEQRHARQADRLMIISPMVDARAREAARRLQIDMYSFAEEAGEALSGEAERSDRATNVDC